MTYRESVLRVKDDKDDIIMTPIKDAKYGARGSR